MALTGGEQNKIEVIIGARDETGTALSSVEQKLQSVADNWKRVGKQMMLVGGIGTTAMIGIIKSTTDFGNAIDKVRKQTGMTGEEIIKLRYAAEQEHASFEALTKSIPILTKYMQYAAEGMDTYKREFDRMGISVVDGEGNLRSAYEVLLDMAGWMADEGVNENEKLATAMALLGRRGAELVPFLKMGRAEIARLGEEGFKLRGMTEKQISEFEAFGDETYKMQETLAGLKDQIAIALLPMISLWVQKIQALTEWFRGLSPELKEFISKAVLIGSVMLVAGGGLIFFGGQLAQIGVFVIQAIKWFQALGTSGAISIGMLTTAMLKFMAVLAGAVALMELLMELKGFIQSKQTQKEALARGEEVDEIRRALMAGEITNEEAKRRATGIRMGTAEEATYSKAWGMTGLERVGHEVGRFQQVFADIKVTKEDEIGKKINTALKPILAGQ